MSLNRILERVNLKGDIVKNDEFLFKDSGQTEFLKIYFINFNLKIEIFSKYVLGTLKYGFLEKSFEGLFGIQTLSLED